MKLYCPHCGVKGAADDSYRGKKVKCPKCLGTFVAIEPVAADMQEALELPAAVATEETVATEIPEGLPREEEPLKETEIPAEEIASAEAIPEEAVEEASDKAVEEASEEAAEEEAVEDEVTATGQEVQETVLSWDEIAAEIEAKSAAGERDEAKREEELPASLFAEPEEQELPVAEEILPGQELAESAEARDDGFQQGEEPPKTPVETAELEEQAAAPAKAEAREDHFIFEEQEPVQEVENRPYGMIKEQCWLCGKKNRSGVPFTERSGRVYCPDCLPAAEPEAVPQSPPFAGLAGQVDSPPPPAEEAGAPVFSDEEQPPRLTVGGVLREAWEKTKGAKGTIWAGSAVMYLTVLFLAAATSFLLPMFGQDLAAPTTGMTGQIANYLLQTLTNIMSVLFTGGLLFMGIRKVAGDSINWKMIFTGFQDAGKIIVATVLQSILIFIGFMILVLPGIYLAIGYSMTIPLIVDRKMSPWQAMETSRKAIHKVWWRVFGLYFLMGLLFIVSMVPLGIGLIWTWPMFVILAGVLYRYLFGLEK